VTVGTFTLADGEHEQKMNTRPAPMSGGNGGHRPRIRLQLLDSFEVRRDREIVRLPMSARRVVTFLALRGHAVLRVHVAGSLWLDSPEERAFANLRSALWRIHRSGVRLVETSGDTLLLAAGVRVDLTDAGGLARRLIGSVPVGAGADVDWSPLTREVLPDWGDDWVLVEREHFRNLSLQALESLCEHLTAQGRLRQALDVGLATFARDPLRESAHRLLVRIYLADGNAFDAVRQFRLYRDLVRTRLGVDPSAQMLDLVRGLVRDDDLFSGDAAVTAA
jgi:DNA-binding SARP family transcriptional activator